MLSVSEMLSNLCSTFFDDINDIQVRDGCGMWLYFDNSPNSLIAPNITNFVSQAEWDITSSERTRVLIEPCIQNAVHPEHPYMFHVSDRENRSAISLEGLVPKNGGNTTMNRKYDPPRIFLATDLLAAFEFVTFQCGEKRPENQRIPQQFVNPATIRVKTREGLDIWRVRLPQDLPLFRDVLFPGRAVWTPSPIPKDNVSLIWNWRLRESIWRFSRKQGWA